MQLFHCVIKASSLLVMRMRIIMNRLDIKNISGNLSAG